MRAVSSSALFVASLLQAALGCGGRIAGGAATGAAAGTAGYGPGGALSGSNPVPSASGAEGFASSGAVSVGAGVSAGASGGAGATAGLPSSGSAPNASGSTPQSSGTMGSASGSLGASWSTSCRGAVLCDAWTIDGAFGGLVAKLPAPVQIFGAWAGDEAAGDRTLHVTMSAGGAGGPLGVAHYTAAGWSWEVIPGTTSVGAISGTSAQDLWVVGSVAQGAPAVFRSSPNGMWSKAPLPPGTVYGLEVTGPERAMVSLCASPFNVPGTVLQYANGAWTPMKLPQQNEPYTLTSLSTSGTGRVYGVGYDYSGLMGNYVLDVFDGQAWATSTVQGVSLHSPPPVYPPIVAAAAGSHDGKTYALATGGEMGSPATRLFGVSSDLMMWNEVADLDCLFYWGSAALVVTAAGTPIGIAADLPGAPQPLSVMRFGTPPTACAAPSAVDNFFAVGPPTSTALHIFANTHNAAPAHWLLSVGP